MDEERKRFQLISEFRFIHGNIQLNPLLRLSYVDNIEEERKRLIHRINRTETGGCFLITGYRGVGKTCFIDKLINDISDEAKDKSILAIKLNLAKVLEPRDLMHQIIRRLYEGVEEKKKHIGNEDILTYIQESYFRTILNMKCESEVGKKEFISNVIHSHAKGEIRGGIFGFLSGVVKTGLKRERGTSVEDARQIVKQFSYLDYDENTAEADILKITKLLREDNKLIPIVVFDELDKLIENDEKNDKEKNIEKVKNILSALKNIFSSSGLFFLLVAGKDFYDMWIEDRKREDSIYESIFSYDLYICKDWDIGARILEKYVLDYNLYKNNLEIFRYYLNFMAKGILRKAIHEFNNFVDWENENAYLELRGLAIKKVKFYGDLQKLLHDRIDREINQLEKILIPARRMDKLKYIAYNRIIDKVLKGSEFNMDELQDKLIGEFKKEEEIMKGLLSTILKILQEGGWLEISGENNCRLAISKERERVDFEGRREILTQRERINVDQKVEAERLKEKAKWKISAAKEVKEGREIEAVNLIEIYEMLIKAKELNPEDTEIQNLIDEEIKPHI